MQTCKGNEAKELSEEKIKTVTIRLPEGLHRDLKIKIAQEGVTLQNHLLHLIQADLKKKSAKK